MPHLYASWLPFGEMALDKLIMIRFQPRAPCQVSVRVKGGQGCSLSRSSRVVSLVRGRVALVNAKAGLDIDRRPRRSSSICMDNATHPPQASVVLIEVFSSRYSMEMRRNRRLPPLLTTCMSEQCLHRAFFVHFRCSFRQACRFSAVCPRGGRGDPH